MSCYPSIPCGGSWKGLPTTVVAASKDEKLAEYIQDVFMTDRFRVYTNSDVIGVELGGALKNIIALGAESQMEWVWR